MWRRGGEVVLEPTAGERGGGGVTAVSSEQVNTNYEAVSSDDVYNLSC